MFLALFAAIGMALLLLAQVAPFPFIFDSIGPATTIWSMPQQDATPTVYLTFDDGPNPTATPGLLDTLAATDAVATFFVIDRYVTEDTAPILRRMFAEGHAVGLHSHTRVLAALPPDDLAQLLTEMADRIEGVVGDRPCPVFRPHAGWRSWSMLAGLASIDHALVGWGWGLWDFTWFLSPDPPALARRLADRVSDGDIIVLHDGHHIDPSAERRYAAEAAALLVPALRDRGFRLGRICSPSV
jgi:chitooligosaccharide deacetylase